MALSSIDGNVGTDGAIGLLSGSFTTAMDSQFPNHDKSNNNDDNDNDNGHNDIFDKNNHQCTGISDYWEFRQSVNASSHFDEAKPEASRTDHTQRHRIVARRHEWGGPDFARR